MTPVRYLLLKKAIADVLYRTFHNLKTADKGKL